MAARGTQARRATLRTSAGEETIGACVTQYRGRRAFHPL
jgi:hypothetical protein